eukprot:12902848-Prorocentrum_lima.AAC.1
MFYLYSFLPSRALVRHATAWRGYAFAVKRKLSHTGIACQTPPPDHRTITYINNDRCNRVRQHSHTL